MLLPSKGFGLGVFGWTLFALPWNLLAINWTIAVMTSGITHFHALYLLLCWSLGISVIVWKIIFTWFGRVRLYLNEHKMTSSYELLGLKYNLRPVPTQHICKLVRTPRYTRIAGDLEFAAYVREAPQLIVWAGTKKYKLCSEKLITDPELDWLAQEVSDWLRLPITRE